jgi:type IV pilus assembly protein PilP
MITTNQLVHGKKGVLALLAAILLLVYTAAKAVEGEQTENTENQTEKLVELNFEVTKTDYEYQVTNRPDPFVPFFTGETTTEPSLDPNEIVESAENLTGMQLFEPGQLTLVALLQAGGGYFGMVEDFTGRGYVIREGMKIGRRGVITAILPNKVLIEEIAVTRAGKELKNEIVMALRKEGEE